MNYYFGTHLHEPSGKVFPTLFVEKPFAELAIISNYDNAEDVGYLIEDVENIINSEKKDSSELGAIMHQEILWGSHKSKIAQLNSDGTVTEGAAFETKDLLQLLKDWLQFLKNQG